MYLTAPLTYSVINMLSTVVAELVVGQGVPLAEAETIVATALDIPTNISLATTSPHLTYGLGAKAG